MAVQCFLRTLRAVLILDRLLNKIIFHYAVPDDYVWEEGYQDHQDCKQPGRKAGQNVGVHLNIIAIDKFFFYKKKPNRFISLYKTYPQKVGDGGEDWNNVIINGCLSPKHIIEEVEDPRVDPDVGQADVEGHIHGEGEDNAGNQGQTPGAGLEPELQVDNSHHRGVHAETKTELTQLIWRDTYLYMMFILTQSLSALKLPFDVMLRP